MISVAVLFARADSIYKTLPGCDVFDFERDAMTWEGGAPVVAHPPCRAWGQYSTWAKPRPGEKELSIWAIAQVRRFGGVLEHPYASKLWNDAGCLSLGVRDKYGGALFPVYQSWWGHRALKKTCLYVVGAVPDLPDSLPAHATCEVENMGVKEREKTPPELAEFLVNLARKCAR